MNSETGKILAVDFGTNSVGLAVCDGSRQVFFGKGVIRNYGSLKTLFGKIADMCRDEEIGIIVFGLPMGDGTTETDQTERYRGIGKKLQEFLDAARGEVKVVFEDESFTTVDAQRADFGMEPSEREAMRKNLSNHEVAAIILLKRYLAR